MSTAPHPPHRQPPVAPPSSDTARQKLDAITAHLPPRAADWVDRTLSRWPGRLLTASISGFTRIELFDRSMTIAAQFFTSMFPILLMTATWLAPSSKSIGDATGMPKQAQTVLDQAVNGSSSSTFGVIGALIVLVSATSLSRALTRAFAAIWWLPRPSLHLRFAWRWVSALLALALTVANSFTLGRPVADQLPRGLWVLLLTFPLDVAVGVFVPWVLLSGRVGHRQLLPGAILLAVVLLFARPATAVWLPHALDVSADRYGSIGVAFTYLACLYSLSFCWLAAAMIGQVIATDEGWFSQWIRGPGSTQSSSGGDEPRSPDVSNDSS